MRVGTLVLDHVDAEYRRPLLAEAERRGMRSVVLPREISESALGPEVALAVAQPDAIDGCGIERLRTLRKLLGIAPTVLLGPDAGPGLVGGVRELGVQAVVRLPENPTAVVRTCFALVGCEDARRIPEIVGQSPSLKRLRRSVFDIARARCSVLLTGETGTGKGVVARVIHRLSSDRDKPFVQVDCASLSPSLIESELFGHERGAFTGAVSARLGRFETAGDGLVFLDEIGELVPTLQSKFLRVLEDREFERVGGARTLGMSARVIAATSRDLEDEVAAGRFRPDLYYRLRVVHIHMPPLREHLSDVPLLVASALPRLARSLELPEPEVRQESLDRLMLHSWPGNVRELMNVLESLLVRSQGREIHESDVEEVLPSGVRAWSKSPAPALPEFEPEDVAAMTAEEERARLLELLIATGGNVARVARRMSMARSTIRYKIRRYGLSDHIPRD